MDELMYPSSDEVVRSMLENDLHWISQTEEFSAVVSGAATENDFKKLRFHLLSAGLSEGSCETDDDVQEIAQYIASRIIGDCVRL